MSEFASTYDSLAGRYDDFAGAVVPPLREKWARKLERFVAPGERVVELGCGTGTPVAQSLSSRYEYTGIDASPGMLARARQALPDCGFVHADMEDATFTPGSVGGVVAFYSIVHVPRERHGDLFVAIASWLRPGGAFVASLHSRDEPDDCEINWLGAGPMRWSGFDRDTNLSLLSDAGLEVVECTVIEQIEPGGQPILPLWMVARRPE